MRYLVGFVFLLVVLGVVRLVGCGDDDQGIPCQTNEECDDDNECTDDHCYGKYCENTGVVRGIDPMLRDLESVLKVEGLADRIVRDVSEGRSLAVA